MATQPEPTPDTIEPGAPSEAPPLDAPEQDPGSPAEIEPPVPDYDQPDTGPIETPPPPGF